MNQSILNNDPIKILFEKDITLVYYLSQSPIQSDSFHYYEVKLVDKNSNSKQPIIKRSLLWRVKNKVKFILTQQP